MNKSKGFIKYDSFEEALFNELEAYFKGTPVKKERFWLLPDKVIEVKNGFYEKTPDSYTEIIHGSMNKISNPDSPEVLRDSIVLIYVENKKTEEYAYTFVYFDESARNRESLCNVVYVNDVSQKRFSYSFPIGFFENSRNVIEHSKLKALAEKLLESRQSEEYLTI